MVEYQEGHNDETFGDNLAYILRDILILSDSFYLSPLANIESIFGKAESWFNREPYSEYQIVNLARLARLGRFLKQASLPGRKERKPTYFTIKPGKGSANFKNEAWFFINGVATNRTIATWNGRQLVKMFGRPIMVIHNPTDGLLLDLVECAFDRTLNWKLKVSKYVVARLRPALRAGKKVVVIAHSQGGIIVASALKQLLAEFDSGSLNWSGLEIYTFACPADEMATMSVDVKKEWRKKTPDAPLFMEHYANRNDLVARLGILRRSNDDWQEEPARDLWSRGKRIIAHQLNRYLGEEFFNISIAGDLYINDRYGHLMNAHYLPTFCEGQYLRIKDDQPCSQSRLFQYLGGGRPKPFIVKKQD